MAAYNANGRGAWCQPEEERKWRQVELQWAEAHYEDTKVSIANRKPQLPNVPAYNVLLVGCIHAGKSSAIGTFMSAMRGDVGQYAAAGVDDESVTKKLKKFRLRPSSSDPPLPIHLWDTMGFEESASATGPSMRDLEYIMDGNIMDGYKFDPKESIAFYSPFFNKKPEEADKMHVVVIVISASTLDAMPVEVQTKLKQVIQMARGRDIRVALLLTKCDAACTQVNDDLTKVFRSRSILGIVNAAEEKLGISRSCIYAIRNYWDNVTPDLNVNILALDSLQHILKLADITLEQNTDKLPVDQQERPLLDTQWRDFQFSKEELDRLWTELADVTTVDGAKTLNLCLFGPVGSGKSAFINTVLTEFCQRIKIKAFMGAHDAASPTTTEFAKYPVRLGSDGEQLAMSLWDTMGLIADVRCGLHPQDVDTILDGHIKDKTTLNCLQPFVVPQGCTRPELDDKMHLVILTVDATKIDEYHPNLIKRMTDVGSEAKKKSIPTCVLVTNMDRVSEHVRKDTGDLYRSHAAEECLKKVFDKLNIPMSRVLPVVNIHNDTEIQWKKSLLIVHALDTMMDCAKDYVKDQGDRRNNEGLVSAFKGMFR